MSSPRRNVSSRLQARIRSNGSGSRVVLRSPRCLCGFHGLTGGSLYDTTIGHGDLDSDVPPACSRADGSSSEMPFSAELSK